MGKVSQKNMNKGVLFSRCCLLGWFCECQFSIGIPTSNCDNCRWASRHACRKALQAFYGDFCPFIQQGLVELTKIPGRVVKTGVRRAQFIPNMLYGVTVWRSCRLLHFGDVALLWEIKDYPSMVRCGVIVLVAVVIPEMMPGKWH